MKPKNVYRLAIEMVFALMKLSKSIRPMKALFGKKAMFEGQYYLTLVDYIRFCRSMNRCMTFTGEEF